MEHGLHREFESGRFASLGRPFSFLCVLAMRHDDMSHLRQSFEGLLQIDFRVGALAYVCGEVDQVEDLFEGRVQLVAKCAERV